MPTWAWLIIGVILGVVFGGFLRSKLPFDVPSV